MRQAVILAGGKGTRLRQRTGETPKPLVDISGIPLLGRQMLLLKRHGFTDVKLLVSYKADQIREYCTSQGNWGLSVTCIDDVEPRGTAGAVIAVLDMLAEDFLVVYGDTMLEVDLIRFHSSHVLPPTVAATLFLHPNDHPHDSDLVDMDENGFVTVFSPYPRDNTEFHRNLVNAALYWIRRDALEPWSHNRAVLDFGRDLFPELLLRGALIRGYNSPEYIKDCGTPARLAKVCEDFVSGKIQASSLDRKQAAVFLDRDGTINKEVDHLCSLDQFELLPGADRAIRRLNLAGYRCCVISNQPVIARGECSPQELRKIHNKMESLLGRQGAFVDRIYYCPHHPDRGFPGELVELKFSCNCRKPNIGMIEQARDELNIAYEQSWLIGDSTVDIETARRAGIRSILIETGYGGLDHKMWARPDATVPDLEAAVGFILDDYPRMLSDAEKLASAIGQGAIVLVGGHSRTGKSTFASVLRDALRLQGKGVSVISVDSWLKSESDRQPGVLGRYEISDLQALVSALGSAASRPAMISVPGYHKLSRESVGVVQSLSISPNDIVILEGTVALALQVPDQVETHRIHVEIDESERRRRVLREYQLRRLSEAEAQAIYASRSKDEYPVIERLAGTARRVRLPVGH